MLAKSSTSFAHGNVDMVSSWSENAVLLKNIKTPDPIPQEGIDLANELMRSGQLYRYSAESDEKCIVSRCEFALADYTGHKYCVALNSCGSAIFMALKCVGAQVTGCFRMRLPSLLCRQRSFMLDASRCTLSALIIF
jgi:hypothetical protein